MSSHAHRRAHATPTTSPTQGPALPGASNQSLLDAIRGGAVDALGATPTLSAMPTAHTGSHGHSPAATLGHAAGAAYTGFEGAHAMHPGHDGPGKGAALAPLALASGLGQLIGPSHADSVPEAIAQRTAAAAETGSGAIGTLGLIANRLGWKGASKLAAKASPIGAVMSALSTGYSLGGSGNRGIEKLGWLGKQSAEYGDPRKNANWSDKAADAGRWVRKRLGGGRLAKIAGGAATLGASVPMALGAAVTGVGNTAVETAQALGAGGKWLGNKAMNGVGSALGWPSLLEAVQTGMPPEQGEQQP